jgi:exodeoxyribonuclease VII large subunit
MLNLPEEVITVSQLTQYIKNLFAADSQLNRLWVSGEISNFKHHNSGHMYFTLKDASSSLRCVMFRLQNLRLAFRPANGMKVVAGGRLSVYERDGQYQMYVNALMPEGVGSLSAAFEELKKRLAAEGLFDPENKKSLPPMPARIGLITSPTGAAVRDILTTASRRFPQAEILIVPVLVQGQEAAGQIAQALEFLNQVPGMDVIIIARGGGSIEELWAFNEEVVARAIFASLVPVVSAVGHETDFTIADFVADVRAATPTAAAELVVPDQREIIQWLAACRQRMSLQLLRRLEHDRRYLEKIASSRVLTRPMERLDQQKQLLDSLAQRLENRMDYLRQGYLSRLALLEGKLGALSPTAVLARGFAICFDRDGKIVRDAEKLSPGDKLHLRLERGTADTVVERVNGEDNNE